MQQIRIALIGAGSWGRFHLDLWRQNPTVRVARVFDVSRDAAADAARRFDIPVVAESMESAVAAPDVDAVMVCTPNRLHRPAVVAALDAGKHVLCEKPLAASSDDVRAMIAARDRSGKLLMCAQHLRFEQRTQTLKRLIDAGRLGRVYYARAHWLRRRGAPDRPGFLKREQSGGGAGWDIGVHVLDLAFHLMNCPRPTRVSGVTARVLADRGDVLNQWGAIAPQDFEVEEFAAGLIHFHCGAALALESSWLLNQPEHERVAVQLYGDAGGAHWPELKLATSADGALLDVHVASGAGGEGHRNEQSAFVDAILTGRPSPVPAEESLVVVQMLEALYESARSNREVTLAAG